MASDGTGEQPAEQAFSQTKGIQCQDCAKPIASSDLVGFCRRCGAPLCINCSSDTMTLMDQRTVAVPLVVVSVSSSTTVEAPVAICKRCKSDMKAGNWRALRIGGEAALVFWLAISIPLIALAGLGAAPAILLVIGAISIFFMFLVYFIIAGRVERQYRPACPVCGRDAMKLILKQASKAGYGKQEIPNHIECSCGYKGPRAPFDGLSKFVAKFGVEPLAEGPLQGMAGASMRFAGLRGGAGKAPRQ